MNCIALKKSNCKNCYKCIRHCPVKAIRFSGNQAYIIDNECILCGHCFVVCPQNAKQIVDETEKAKVLIQSPAPVIASIAPSFVANYDGVGIEAMRDALKKLGFFDAEETAIGATVVKTEYERMLREDAPDVVISSCCHSVNLLIQKHYPRELSCLAPVLSPMQAHCRDIKRRHPEAKTVFIGPCVAKKDEAEHYDGIVDAVLTFDELSAWFKEKGIEPEKKIVPKEDSRARLFPTTGGILKTMDCSNSDYTYMAIDGVDNCIAVLRDIESGRIHKCFIEMSACVGSCIGGPGMEKFHSYPAKDYVTVTHFAGSKDFPVMQPDSIALQKEMSAIEQRAPLPSESEIKEILLQMGKKQSSDELNCGSCGYNTCREKAVAIYQGKAEVSMCLPYLKEKAMNFSDSVINNIPLGILVLNEKLEVQNINNAALRIMNMRRAEDIMGCNVVRILEPGDFASVLETERSIRSKPCYLAEYGRHVEETIIYDREYRSLLCILRDVTEAETMRRQKDEARRKTVEIADQVVDKQMRIVQEIAMLLGETAAETKIALTKLKEVSANE